jgi:hypothetical protein
LESNRRLTPPGSDGLDEQDVAAPPVIVEDTTSVIKTVLSKLIKSFVNESPLGGSTVQFTAISIDAVADPFGFVDVIVYVLLGE